MPTQGTGGQADLIIVITGMKQHVAENAGGGHIARIDFIIGDSNIVAVIVLADIAAPVDIQIAAALIGVGRTVRATANQAVRHLHTLCQVKGVVDIPQVKRNGVIAQTDFVIIIIIRSVIELRMT